MLNKITNRSFKFYANLKNLHSYLLQTHITYLHVYVSSHILLFDKFHIHLFNIRALQVTCRALVLVLRARKVIPGRSSASPKIEKSEQMTRRALYSYHKELKSNTPALTS